MKIRNFCLLLTLTNSLYLAVSARQAPQYDQCRKQFKSYFDLLQLPGISIAVVQDGKIIYRQVEGFADLEKRTPINKDHLFQIASVTKTFTAALIMQYEQEGKASLEDYILNYRYLDIYFGYPYNIDANARIKHFMSHTSAGDPGSTFLYNGQRFNYIYGVFEKAGGYAPNTDAFCRELKSRIFKPLGMEHTITGFPAKRNDPVFTQIAKPYLYDTSRHIFTEDTVNYKWTTAFPATGILSTIDDLAKYTAALDGHRLITAASYAKITTPVALKDGTQTPYGIGWFTEKLDGVQLHWHYGFADAFAALLVRVPEKKLSFILLSNSSIPSGALRLGSGHIWQSPFVTTFLRYFVWADKKTAATSLDTEELIGRALFIRYAENDFGTHKGEAKRLMESLNEKQPDRFNRYAPELIYLLTDLREKSLQVPLQKQINAYLKDGHIQPYVIMDIVRYYEKEGHPEMAFRFNKMLADSKGFEEYDQTVNACKAAGRYLLNHDQVEEGRQYYWRAVNYLKMMGTNDNTLKDVIQEMNDNTR